jgi:hypothetical protein
MPTFDLATLTRQQTTLGAVASSLPWESELSELAEQDPDFAMATVVVLDTDLTGDDFDIELDNLYPNDLDQPLPFLLLVRGSMRVRSVYNTDLDGGTHLMVLGDVHADFMITLQQETFVGGDLRLHRAWWGVGEAGRLMVRGTISAPAMIADGYRVDADRIRQRHGVDTTAFLWAGGTDYLPRPHVLCVLADDYVDVDDVDVDEPHSVVDWVDIIDVLNAVDDGADPFADPVTTPSVDLFIPEPDLLGFSANELFACFEAEVSAESLAAVFTDPLVVAECTGYDDDLIDGDRKYSVRQAGDRRPARLTIMRVLSDPDQLYRFHHFEARESSSGAIHIELLTQTALGTEHEVAPVAPHDLDHYIDALSCFRRLRTFLAEEA